VDNGKVYSGKALTLACSELGIHKIHSTPYYPVSRGKQERFFRTLRDQLLNEVGNVEPMELAALNRLLVAWLSEYHSTPRSGTPSALAPPKPGRPEVRPRNLPTARHRSRGPRPVVPW